MSSDSDLRSSRFRAERETSWRRLEALVTTAERKGLRSMAFDDARELAILYRQATTSLAIAREISLDKALLAYLEALTARAYLTVYAPQEPVRDLVWRFLTHGAPAALRRSWPALLLAFVCLALGAICGGLLFFEDAAIYRIFVPDGLAGDRTPSASTETLRRAIYDADPETDRLGTFATFLFSHNTRIAIFVFGLGAFACAPGLILVFLNGLTFGAFVALHIDRGLGWDIGGWLSIHGVTELAAVCVASAGGLRLGLALLFPGEFGRIDALHRAGRDAAKLALVAAMMLIVAAVLEGFGRQLVQDMGLRYGIGWGIGALWLIWAVRSGRRPRS